VLYFAHKERTSSDSGVLLFILLGFWTVLIVWCTEQNQMLQKLDLFHMIMGEMQVAVCRIGERDSHSDRGAELLPTLMQPLEEMCGCR
jgi:hypothetical protein